MYHRIWTVANLLLIVISVVYIWFFRPHDSTLVVTSQTFAQVGVVLFLININMYFSFLVIRNTSIRKVKIRLAKFSRYLMKWHIKIALLGTTVIIGHASINLYEFGRLLGFTHMKFVSGYMALVLLLCTLAAGYLRHTKASGFRRKFHLILAMLFLAAFVLHMFVSV